MAEKRPKYMNWILECINLLRSRKSRPDLERICRTMLKCHGIDERDTEEDLAVLIASGIVTKRSFKGAISYRNASGWHRVLGSGKVSRASRWVGEAIRALDRGYGVSAVEIDKFITARHPYYHNLKARIKIALKDDLDHGRVWSVSDGMYRLLESAEVSWSLSKHKSRELFFAESLLSLQSLVAYMWLTKNAAPTKTFYHDNHIK